MKSYTTAFIILSTLSYTQAAAVTSSSFSIETTTSATTTSSAIETATTETDCSGSTTTETVFLPAPTFTCVCGPQIPPTVSVSSSFTIATSAPDSSFSISETATITSSVASASESSDGSVTVTATGGDDLRKKLARRQDQEDDCDDASTSLALSSAIFSAPPVEPSGVVTCVCGPDVATPTTSSSLLPTIGIPTQFSSSSVIPSSSLVVSDTIGTVTASVPTVSVSSSIADF